MGFGGGENSGIGIVESLQPIRAGELTTCMFSGDIILLKRRIIVSQKRNWSNFEERVREMASYIWSRPCTPQRIGGVNIDGVTVLDAEIQCFVEITEEKSLSKVREDILKLHTAKNSLFLKGIMARCFCVVNGDVTPAMRDAGKEQHVHVLSFEDFGKQFFDFETYSSARKKAPFGSSINPLTGDTDETRYVSVRYTVDGRKDDISTKGVAEYLLSGKNVVLLGEYGSGKSRCIREVFSLLGPVDKVWEPYLCGGQGKEC